MRLNSLANIVLLLCSILLPLYAVETGLAIWQLSSQLKPAEMSSKLLHQRKEVAKSVDEGENFDTRPKIDVVLQMMSQGVAVVPMVYPVHFLDAPADEQFLSLASGKQIYPLSGISNADTVFCNESGTWILYESDEYGFHNPKDLYRSGMLDVIAIGDSFTHGSCVASDKNAVAVIRQTYPHTLNLGIGGNGPLLELAIFREYAEPLQSGVVLWVYYNNDLINLEREKHHEILHRYLDPGYRQGLRSLQKEIDDFLKEEIEKNIRDRETTLAWQRQQWQETKEQQKKRLLRDIVRLRHLRAKWQTFVKSTQKEPSPLLPSVENVDRASYDYVLFRHILSLVQKTTASWGGQMYFVDLSGDDTQVSAVVEDLQIPIIPTYQTLLNHEDIPSLYPYRIVGGHYGEKGNQVIADTILQVLHNDRYLRNKNL